MLLDLAGKRLLQHPLRFVDGHFVQRHRHLRLRRFHTVIRWAEVGQQRRSADTISRWHATPKGKVIRSPNEKAALPRSIDRFLRR